MKHIFSSLICIFLIAAVLFSFAACQSAPTQTYEKLVPDAKMIELSDHTATIDGVQVTEFDYTWHCDPTVSHEEDDKAPAEYHTGTKPETDAAVYIDSDLPYYPSLPQEDFTLVNYDGEQEWAYYYKDGSNEDFIFATLPMLGGQFPSQMMHTAEEAAENRVLHITQPGIYQLQGTWKGQILVDLGDQDETFTDESAKVTLILNGADIDCTVSAGIMFYSVYECDNGWEDRTEYSVDVDTDHAGAVVYIADGTQNNVSGANVFRMLKTKYKNEDDTGAVPTQKKQRKTDGALYSYRTMEITGGKEGTGNLNVTSTFEGIDSELHLAFTGGNITVNSQDDGVNVNEDNVSVVKFCGGHVILNPAQGAEGDGVDSNGFALLQGGTLEVNGVRVPDNALDSECGIYYEGGTVIIDRQTQTYTPGTSFRESGIQSGMGQQPGNFPGGFNADAFDLALFKEQVAALPEDATLEDVLALLGINLQPDGQMQQPGQMPSDGQMPPDGQMPGQMPPDGQTPPEKP